MKQLGQKSLISLFSSSPSSSSSSSSSSSASSSSSSILRGNLNNRKCGDLSLNDFLDKTIACKEIERKKDKEKREMEEKEKFSAAPFPKNVILSEESKLHTPKASSFSAPIPSCSERVCESLRVRRISSKDSFADDLKKKRRKRSFGDGYVDKPSCLLVLGDEPVFNRPKVLRSDSDRSFFNHYSDGNGWWEHGMVGLEAAKTCVEWEGIGSMSLGDPFMSPL